jgi:hypothetical protein
MIHIRLNPSNMKREWLWGEKIYKYMAAWIRRGEINK